MYKDSFRYLGRRVGLLTIVLTFVLSLQGCSRMTLGDIQKLSDVQLMNTLRSKRDPNWMPPFGPVREAKLADIELLKSEAKNRFKELPPGTMEALINGKVTIGMTKQQVLMAKGQPDKVNRTILSSGITEQWVYTVQKCYGKNGSNCVGIPYMYAYLKDGVVSGIQD